jgi:hypothetical protein
MPIESDELTIAVWLNRKAAGSIDDVFSFGNPDGASISLRTLDSAGTLSLQVEAPNPPLPAWNIRMDGSSLPADAWELVGVVVTAKDVTLFVDGAPVETRPLALGSIQFLRGFSNWIGHSASGDSDFNGMVGEVTVYERALSAVAIKKMADQGFR